FGEPRQIPERDARLVRERVTTAMIDGAERLLRVVLVEESARTEVDGLARDGRVVRVHHPVHEADPEPRRYEARLPEHDAFEERQCFVAGSGQRGVVPGE